VLYKCGFKYVIRNILRCVQPSNHNGAGNAADRNEPVLNRIRSAVVMVIRRVQRDTHGQDTFVFIFVEDVFAGFVLHEEPFED